MSWKAEVSHSRTACRPAFSRIAHRRNPVARAHRAVSSRGQGQKFGCVEVVVFCRDTFGARSSRRGRREEGVVEDAGLGALPSCMIRVLLPEVLFLAQPPSFPLRSAPPRPAPPIHTDSPIGTSPHCTNPSLGTEAATMSLKQGLLRRNLLLSTYSHRSTDRQ